MADQSVFDIALAILHRSKSGGMSPLKLQKLCFYTFGWYAHLTGQRLFPEPIYAMQLGPVVGPLLSAHRGLQWFTEGELQEARQNAAIPSDPYMSDVIDAVWATYGAFSHGELIELTHEEKIWEEAWGSRQQGSARADIEQAELVRFFLSKTGADVSIYEHLPERHVSFVSASTMRRMEDEQAEPHLAFVDRMRQSVGVLSLAR